MIPVSICNRNNPKEVIESDNVHYFYWPVEIGLGYIEISGKKLPISPIKPDDVEPIKTVDVGGKTTIVSRYHYDILLYFNKLKLDDGKPVIDFYYGSHTPMTHSESESYVTCNIRNSADTGWAHIQEFKILFAVYKYLLLKTASKLCETKSYTPKKMDSNLKKEVIIVATD